MATIDSFTIISINSNSVSYDISYSLNSSVNSYETLSSLVYSTGDATSTSKVCNYTRSSGWIGTKNLKVTLEYYNNVNSTVETPLG